LRDLNNALSDIKNVAGNVTAEEMIKQMQDIMLKIEKLDNQ